MEKFRRKKSKRFPAREIKSTGHAREKSKKERSPLDGAVTVRKERQWVNIRRTKSTDFPRLVVLSSRFVPF
jgi:hypothetical protein